MLDTFTSTLAPVTAAEAEALCLRYYNRPGSAIALPGERDQNFQIRGERESFVLKLHHPDEDPAGLDFQTAALRHLEGFPVPRVIPTVNGNDIELLPDGRRLRMLSWVEGTLLRDHPVDDDMRRRLGRMLGQLNVALANFSHPAAQRPLLWDIQQVSAIRPLLHHVAEPVLRHLVETRLDAWERHCAPVQAALPWQVIHNDANPGNVLVQGDSLGLLDFGDMLRAPRVQEIAVACSYYLGKDPLVAMAQIAGAYDEAIALSPEEWEMIPEMLGARTAASLTIAVWRTQLLGKDPASILTHIDTCCTTLRWLEKNPNAGKRLRKP